MAFNIHDFDKFPEIEGKLIGKNSKVPPFGKYVFALQTKEGVEHIWGTKQIRDIFMEMPFGTIVRVKYKGKQKDPESDYMIKIFTHEIIDFNEKVEDKDFSFPKKQKIKRKKRK